MHHTYFYIIKDIIYFINVKKYMIYIMNIEIKRTELNTYRLFLKKCFKNYNFDVNYYLFTFN